MNASDHNLTKEVYFGGSQVTESRRMIKVLGSTYYYGLREIRARVERQKQFSLLDLYSLLCSATQDAWDIADEQDNFIL